MRAAVGAARPVRALLGAACALAVLCTLLAAPGTGAAAPSVDEVVLNVRGAAGVRPEAMRFRQDITLEVLFLRWNFHADVTRSGDRVELVLHNAPGFIDEDVSASLLEVSEGLDHFDLRLVDEIRRGGDVVYVLQGVPRREGGARGGRIWVNARTWLVEKAELEYPWGMLEVEQTFQNINGYTVLREQKASVSRLGARMTVRYSDYWFAGAE